MNCFLIYPTFADPTQPYLSLPLLKGRLRREGHNVTVIDLNIESVHYLFSEKNLKSLSNKIEDRFHGLRRQPSLNIYDMMEYRRIERAVQNISNILRLEDSPLDILRDENKFYNYTSYAVARDAVEKLFESLNAAYFPYEFGFNRANHMILPWSYKMLDEYCAGEKSPLNDFYEERLALMTDATLIGISLTFASQIPETFYLCRMIRRMIPHCRIVLGGACISQIALGLDDAGRKELLKYCDGICLYEGEETLSALMSNMNVDVPNFLYYDGNGTLKVGPVSVLRLEKPDLPDYSDLDLGLYLSPTPMLLYAPTRGCYWNKCSFCQYGFNRSGSHSYREIPSDEVVGQIARLVKTYGVKHFYMSCDVMSRSYVVSLAEALVRRGLAIKWSSDLRCESTYTEEDCKTLYKSGMRAVAFGMESGSQRVLNLMNKGLSKKEMTNVNRCFHDAGIATAWMTFTGHPGENTSDAIETIKWIGSEQKYVDLFITGQFGLISGADIACNPDKYGIKRLYYTRGDSLKLYPLFEMSEKRTRDIDSETIDAAIGKLASGYRLDHYPWVGAISTHHSFLYFLRFNQRCFSDGHTTKASATDQFEEDESDFLSEFLQRALKIDDSGFAPLSEDYFKKACLLWRRRSVRGRNRLG